MALELNREELLSRDARVVINEDAGEFSVSGKWVEIAVKGDFSCPLCRVPLVFSFLDVQVSMVNMLRDKTPVALGFCVDCRKHFGLIRKGAR